MRCAALCRLPKQSFMFIHVRLAQLHVNFLSATTIYYYIMQQNVGSGNIHPFPENTFQIAD